MTRKQQRLVLIASVGCVLILAVTLVLFAFRGQITLFRTPTEIAEQHFPEGQRLRVGGLVAMGSVVKGADGQVDFEVTDTANALKVSFRGLLPDLFREGQGVVAEGTLGPGGLFVADTVLAKHDERYMPKEVVDALKKQGVWKEGEAGGGMAAPAN